MLEEHAELRPLLRCPRSRSPLAFDRDGAATALDGSRYGAIDGLPVLIDFDRSVISEASVLAASGTGAVDRPSYGGATRLLKRLLSPDKPETRINITELIRRLEPKAATPRVLVIGGGTVGQGLAALYDHPDLRLISFDLYRSAKAQFIADAHSIPLADGCVDAVIVQAVLEHVLEPERVVAEIWRVLNADGLVYAETPFLQQVHEGAYDFTRFTESGHRYLFRRFGLIKSGVCGGIGTQLTWSIDYFVRGVFRSRLAGKAAKLAFAWLRLFDRIIPSEFASDAASGVYFLGCKSSLEMSPAAAVDFYRGAQRRQDA